MLKTVRKFIVENNMIEENDKVVVGLSGGADSVALLLLLCELMTEKSFSIVAVHLNHMIRGAEADRDEEFVKSLCEKYGVELHSFRIAVEEEAGKNGESVEEAGRRIRYALFENVEGVTKIAVAHHKDDRAETVLHNLARGTSINGMAGIRPVRDKIIRPLLCVSRKEIEDYLKENGVAYCTDSTNLSNDYLRNKLRNVVMPYLRENINKDVAENINNFANDASEYYDYVKMQAQKAYERCVEKTDDFIDIDIQEFRKYHPVIQKEVIINVICKMSESRKDISRVHIESVASLVEKTVSKTVDLPYGIKAVRTYSTIRFLGKENDSEQDASKGWFYSQKEMFECDADDILIEEMVFDGNWENETNDYTKIFDCDKIKGTLSIRKRQPKDYLEFDSTGNKKLLKSYFIDNKVPKEIRDNVWVVAEGNHILWVLGGRISSYYKTDSVTNKVIKITVRRN